MGYRLTPWGKTRRSLPGVPWRNLSDEEYEAAVARHPGMEEQGYFVKEEPKAEPAGEAPRSSDASATRAHTQPKSSGHPAGRGGSDR